MISDLLLASGLILSTASQLRPTALPVGPGEVCLAVWLVLSLGREAGRLGPILTPPLSRLLAFWTIFALALSLGTLTGYFIGDVHDPDLFIHDIIAYTLLAGVSCLCVVEPDAGMRLHRVIWMLATLGTAFLIMQLAQAWGLIKIGQLEPWYWDRLRGWSENPNQLAIFCAVLGLLTLHLAATTTPPAARFVAIFCLIFPIWVGRLTKSDTFSLVLVASGLIFATLKIRTWLLTPELKPSLRSAFVWILIFALPAAIISAVPLSYSAALQAEGFFKELSKDNGKGTEEEAQLRFHSWNEAVDRGIQAGFLGLGPGPHLEIPPSLVAARKSTKDEPKNLEHPEANFTPNFEAHNTLLDLFTQGGLIAVLDVIWLVAVALAATYRFKLDALTTLLCGLILFSIFHLIVRHPMFWFSIAFCLVMVAEARKPPLVRKWA